MKYELVLYRVKWGDSCLLYTAVLVQAPVNDTQPVWVTILRGHSARGSLSLYSVITVYNVFH